MESTIVVPTPSELNAAILPRIESVRHFKSGRIDRYGKVVGVVEYPKGKVPFDHQAHHYDDRGRVIYFEKFIREFTKPTRRYYRYQDRQLSHAIWVDRYGNIENVHHYRYDDLTQLLVWRAEFDHTGKLFYSISSSYDSHNNLVEEAWYDASNRFVKRYAFTYHQNGEIETESHYDQNNAPIGFNHMTYDARGNLLERRWNSPQGQARSRFVYTVNAKNQVTVLRLFGPDNKIKTEQQFSYDEIGNVVRECWFDDRGELVKDLRF